MITLTLNFPNSAEVEVEVADIPAALKAIRKARELTSFVIVGCAEDVCKQPIE